MLIMMFYQGPLLNMLAFVGDVHGKFREFRALFDSNPELRQADAVVQLGDFGLFPDYQETFDPPPVPVYWLDGNHEYFPDIRDIVEPTEIRENLIYVPRGSVLELGGLCVGFLGGGESIDRHHRQEGVDWFPEETIRYADMMRFSANARVDVLATHTPPLHVMRALIGPYVEDPSARAVESVWEGLGRPLCVCGHLHMRRTIGRVEILGELDVWILGSHDF